MFTVPTGYNFHDPACKGVDFICWPTVGASSVEYYSSNGKGVPGWDRVLLITTLKRGSLYVLPLNENGQAAAGHMSRYFQSENRYRDTAVSPDGKTIFIATDPGGLAEALGGGATRTMQDPGAILAFTYQGEGGAATTDEARRPSVPSQPNSAAHKSSTGGEVSSPPPHFTAGQAAAGKTAYNSNCAVCHGSTLTNGTFAPPLAGEYFKTAWFGRTIKAFYGRAKAMPPASPASLPEATYVDIVAYILEVNGFKAGDVRLPGRDEELDKMAIK
jgi:mono/diheme cytochrome c family protein